MATYTPNLNLGKPEVTDPFGNFRQLFNDNMDILDNGGGGGSGGHTIVNPSGTDMPAEGKLQFTGGVTVTDDSVNGKTVVDISGGGGNVYGAFIDTNRVLATYNSSGGSAIPSYTALEDCFVAFYVFGKNSQTCRIYVDSAEILTVYFQGDGVQSPTLYLKKGQTLSFSSFDYWSFHYEVYGLTQGTNGIFTPIIYSDNERVVGVWRDNKPLYQRTFVFETPVAVSYSSFTDTTIDSTDIENIVDNHATHADGTNYGSLIADPTRQSHTKVGLQTNRNGNNANVKTLTIRYTKISDVAGSGNWNTDGVPTVHYSTSEQVIGTYLGKPLYQRTWDNLAISITTNTWANTGISATVIDTIVDGTMQDDNKQKIGGTIGFMSSHTYIGVYPQIGNRDLTSLTVQYTKTTD